MLDLYRGGLSIRTLRIWIEHLPPESATKTALRNAIPAEVLEQSTDEGRPDLAPWSGTETLLAAVKDEIRILRFTLLAVNGNKAPEFTPTPRPGIPPKSAAQKRGLTDEQRRALDPRLRNQPKEA
ncbi:hypothetical protein M2271_003540 [Streptomyces sp. LBL]|uniref:hypothetical protein n=1 Tax=Streptomyces sp. LBL TaxID=2940562 RepID=UPI00247404D9|nr:hypothetical protein [Streptomyces sp. LBL]MDH6625729.1 hypothetical protein [Streptomyces sp. LBL]